MLYFESGSEKSVLSSSDIKQAVYKSLDMIGRRKKVLVIPPDFTRFHSGAGEITSLIYKYYKSSLKDVLPALGTHTPMSGSEISEMFKGIPPALFRVHDWRNDISTVGTVPGDYISALTGGIIDYSWPAQVNNLVAEGDHDLILSVGQVVPHEVIGMASYNKNLFVGTGGREGINKSHFIGAAYGLERILGKVDNPVRRLLNYASENFISHLPVVYIHT
ncbi:MAG: lactate racemase domain-containing protein, partial [Bacteroidales bacterium]